MRRVIVHRRPDGLVQIDRMSRWRVLLDPVAGALVGMLALCGTLIVGLAATLVAFPLAIALTLPLLALGAWAGQLARSTRLAAPPVVDPPPRRVA